MSLPDAERAAAEREIVALARTAALGELTGDIGHDLGNGLFALLGLVDLLAATMEPGSPEAERLELIQETGLGVRAMLSRLLAFARADTGGERAALDGAAQAAVALVRHGRGKQLTLDERYPGEPLLVACPAGPLTQAALHLVSGARDFVGNDGTVTVEVAAAGASAAVLRVSPAPLDSLGLVAARRIVEDRGGSLVRSDAMVVLRLPVG